MAFTKSAVATNNISNLANRPLESAPTLKQKFDQYGTDDKTRFNLLIDELEATTGTSGAENIGSKTISGVTGNTPHTQITNLKSQIDARNAENVKLTGIQTIAGIKTFSSSPVVPVAIADTQSPQKKYVDDENLKDVHLTGDQTIAGVKTFSSSPTVPTPTTATQAANKGFVEQVAADFVLGVLSDDSITNSKLGTDIKVGSLASLLTGIKDTVANAINWLYERMVRFTSEEITYYVDAATGSNSNDGLTAGAPFLTIQYAIEKLPKFLAHICAINVAPGTYAETVTIDGFIGNKFLRVNGASVVGDTHIVNAIKCERNSCPVFVTGLKATSTSETTFTNSQSQYISFDKCKTDASTGSFSGFSCSSGIVAISNSIASNRSIGIQISSGSTGYSVNNSGSGNAIGIKAQSASTIGKSGTQPSGTLLETTADGGVITSSDTNAGIMQSPTGTALPATTGTMTATMDGKLKTITPTGACTFNASGGNVGDRCNFVITTSGVSSYTLTWGTSFKTTATLATGTVTAKKFVVSFVYDGTLWVETGRTTAM